MNKYQEALKKLCNGCEYQKFNGECSFRCPAKEELKELVEKATPKEPIIYINECEERKPIFGYICPCCSDWVNNGANYCSGCGQALDWEGEE